MYKKINLLIILFIIVMLSACSNEEKKPFGAENINYNDVERVNKEGPKIEESHAENLPPIGDKTIFSEPGPTLSGVNGVVEPTADIDEEPDYGGIPVVKKEGS